MASNTTSGTPGATKEGGGIQYCDTHKNKKVKFFCKSDQEMFCSKCVLKHTNAKHEVMPVSYKSKLTLSPPFGCATSFDSGLIGKVLI